MPFRIGYLVYSIPRELLSCNNVNIWLLSTLCASYRMSHETSLEKYTLVISYTPADGKRCLTKGGLVHAPRRRLSARPGLFVWRLSFPSVRPLCCLKQFLLLNHTKHPHFVVSLKRRTKLDCGVGHVVMYDCLQNIVPYHRTWLQATMFFRSCVAPLCSMFRCTYADTSRMNHYSNWLKRRRRLTQKSLKKNLQVQIRGACAATPPLQHVMLACLPPKSFCSVS